MNYESYLQLDKLLSAQKPVSLEHDRPAHDEMLFISIHQVYELWFQQILFELDSILLEFSKDSLDERRMDTIVSRLGRINKIMGVLIQQVSILETMTPMDFLEFRDLIYKASGFQSYQFRLLENKLGLQSKTRLPFHQGSYTAQLSKDQARGVQEAEEAPSLFDSIEAWLERTPFLQDEDFDFWKLYKSSANLMFQQDESFINNNSLLSEDEKVNLLNRILSSKASFSDLFDEDSYNQRRAKGEWRFSHKAIHGALLIQVYREQPIFQLPFRLISEVIALDSHLTQWRYRHTLLVRRMLGSRIGTGGSSGAEYLSKSTEQHKIFDDFYKLTTFFIPRNRLPDIPPSFAKKLGFRLDTSSRS